jgi:hypothetical protein
MSPCSPEDEIENDVVDLVVNEHIPGLVDVVFDEPGVSRVEAEVSAVGRHPRRDRHLVGGKACGNDRTGRRDVDPIHSVSTAVAHECGRPARVELGGGDARRRRGIIRGERARARVEGHEAPVGRDRREESIRISLCTS